ncbi:DegV family protein [Deinococcus hopiensis]|uniref:DegV family protein n=1 Tax=Deinococcus hopiensis TaxID=309885 RepID=UPI001FECC5F5|nr:DegV family protein [Deinococcus hopiensis]
MTDSTCDLPPEAAGELHLHVVPLHVQFGGQSFLDWQSIDPDRVYEYQRGGGTVTTAPVTQAAFEAKYRELLETHDQILSVHLSGHLSTTVEHARQAARALNAGDRIHVHDSHMASFPMAELLMAAREVVRAGGGMEQALAAIRTLSERLLVELTVPTLEYLRRGGRISRTQALVGNMLGVRPVLRFDDGRLQAVRRVRASQAARDILSQMESRFGREPVAVTVAHAGRDPGRIAELQTYVKGSKLNVGRGRVQLMGPVIGAHVGPGTYGIMARPL